MSTISPSNLCIGVNLSRASIHVMAPNIKARKAEPPIVHPASLGGANRGKNPVTRYVVPAKLAFEIEELCISRRIAFGRRVGT